MPLFVKCLAGLPYIVHFRKVVYKWKFKEIISEQKAFIKADNISIHLF